MKINKPYKIPSFDQLLKYFRGKGSRKDRHALEKQAQKDSFLADALEGFEISDLNRAQVDVRRINASIQNKNRERHSGWLIAMAATFALLVVAVSGWYVVNKVLIQASGDQLSVEQSQPDSPDVLTGTEARPPISLPDGPSETRRTEENRSEGARQVDSQNRAEDQVQGAVALKQEPETIHTPAAPEIIDSEDNDIAPNAVSPAMSNQMEEVEEIQAGEPSYPDIDALYNPLTTVARTTSPGSGEVSGNAISGTVLDAFTLEPLPGASIMVEGTTHGTTTDDNGNFYMELPSGEDPVLQARYIGMEAEQFTPSGLRHKIITMDQSVVALNEAVTSGRSAVRSSSRQAVHTQEDSMVAPNFSFNGIRPADGYESYQIYLDSVAILPETADSTNALVILTFEVNRRGRPYNFETLRSSGPDLTQQAIEIVSNGPPWQVPPDQNQKVILAIAFRKN